MILYLHYVLTHFLKFCFDLICFKSKQLYLKKWNMFKTPHQQLKVLDYVPKTYYKVSPPDFVNMNHRGWGLVFLKRFFRPAQAKTISRVNF